MKRYLSIALVALFSVLAFSPALADGYYRSAPKCSTCKGCDNAIWNAIKWTVKLPFRIVTSTVGGVGELIVDQDLDGFEKGWDLI